MSLYSTTSTPPHAKVSLFSVGQYQRFCAAVRIVKNTAILGSTIVYNGG